MLKLIRRYFNACSQIAREQNTTRAIEQQIASIRCQDAELHHQREASPIVQIEQLEALRAQFCDEFQAAVMDTAVEIAKIKTPALQDIAQRVALARYLANALPEQKYFVHQMFGPGQSPLMH